jgi:RNA polymerase primary sigma factor
MLIDFHPKPRYSTYMSKAPTMKANQLTASEEIFLIRVLNSPKSVSNRQWALDKLVLSNLGLIHKIVHRFPLKNAACTYEDLFQEGVAGLIHGIEKFDETRGYRLSTYVYRWIQAYVSRYFQNHGKTIRIPVHMSDTSSKLRKEVEELTKQLDHTPSQAECVEHIEDYMERNSMPDTCVSLNAALSEDGELLDLAGVDNTEENDNVLECENLLDGLRDRVSERDYNILCMRFGLAGHPEHTLSEISDAMGITRARCHQIQKECLKELRVLSR